MRLRDVPVDSYFMIFSFLPARELQTGVRCVCRNWKRCVERSPLLCRVVRCSGFYCGGGFNGSAESSSVEHFPMFSAAPRALTVPSFTQSRSHFAFAVVDRTLYAIGGRSGDQRLNACEKLELGAARWEIFAPMSCTRSAPVVATTRSRIFVFGGYNGKETSSSGEMYNCSTGKWANSWSLPIKVSQAGSCTLGNRLIVVGGRGDGNTSYDTIISVDLSSGASEILGNLEHAIVSPMAHAFGDVLMIVGGVNPTSSGATHSKEALLFDTRSRSWMHKGPQLAEGVVNHTGAVADDNTLVLFGGFAPNPHALDKVVVLPFSPSFSWQGAERAGWIAASERLKERRDACNCAYLQ